MKLGDPQSLDHVRAIVRAQLLASSVLLVDQSEPGVLELRPCVLASTLNDDGTTPQLTAALLALGAAGYDVEELVGGIVDPEAPPDRRVYAPTWRVRLRRVE